MAAALLVAACGHDAPASAPAPTPAPSVPVSAYVDVTLTDPVDPPPGLALVLGFVTAGPQGCTPTWGGRLPLDDPAVLGRVRAWRAAAHELTVSFGGERGTELAQRCRDANELAAAYRRVVEVLRPAALDLDVEGAALADAASVHRRDVALQALQADAARRGSTVAVTFTLPADTSGLPAVARALLADARQVGVGVTAVDAMAMNYSQPPADPAAQAMSVAGDVQEALRELHPDDDAAALRRRVRVTPMIGRNDDAAQVFTVRDAARLAALARAAGLGGIGFWSLARDRPCPASTRRASSTCSGVEAPPGAFAAALAGAPTP